MKLAKAYGLTRLVRDLLWLFKHIGRLPRDKLEEISLSAKSLSEKIEKLKCAEWYGGRDR
jgi:hypothetical protein